MYANCTIHYKFFGSNAFQTFQEIIAILVIRKDNTTFNPSCHNMVQSTRGLYSRPR